MTEARRPKGPPVRLRQDDGDTDPRPARPELDAPPPPPVSPPLPARPKALIVSAVLWQLSFVVGLAAVIAMLAGRDDLLQYLVGEVLERRPDDTVAQARSASRAIVTLLVVMAAGFVVIEAALLFGVWQHRRAMRLMLLVVGIAGIAFNAVNYALTAAPEPDSGVALQIGIGAQSILVLIALLLLLSRGVKEWLRGRG